MTELCGAKCAESVVFVAGRGQNGGRFGPKPVIRAGCGRTIPTGYLRNPLKMNEFGRVAACQQNSERFIYIRDIRTHTPQNHTYSLFLYSLFKKIWHSGTERREGLKNKGFCRARCQICPLERAEQLARGLCNGFCALGCPAPSGAQLCLRLWCADAWLPGCSEAGCRTQKSPDAVSLAPGLRVMGFAAPLQGLRERIRVGPLW